MSVAILRGDARALPLADRSVQAVCTSPPYWALRSYLPADHPDKRYELGAEPTPDEFVADLVAVFDEVWRVLRDDGVALVNIGDSYAGKPAVGQTDDAMGWKGANKSRGYQGRGVIAPGLKAKDLCLIPERFALAMQARGWYVRSRIAWVKTSAMPECLAPETKVFIKGPTGHISHTSLDVVHKVWGASPYPPQILTPTGWRRIRRIWETSKHEVVAFDAASVTKVRCSLNHRWPVSHDRRRLATHEVTAGELRDDGYRDYLLHHAIDEWLDGDGGKPWGHTLDYEMGWLLGLYAAEGGFGEVHGHRCKFTVHKDEGALLDRVEDIIQRRFGATVSRRQIKNYESLRFSNADWHRLAPYVVPGGCTEKAINLDVALNASREFRVGLWEGYLAGDGSKRPRGVTAVSASRALRDTMAVVASGIGILTSKGDYVRRDPRTGKDYARFQLWTPYVEHRQQKKGSTAKQVPIRNKVIDHREGMSFGVRMIDLEVDGGLFLIEDGLVTHNSVTDRPSSAWEHIFMFTKSPRYFWDAEAVRQPNTAGTVERHGGPQEPPTADAYRLGLHGLAPHRGTVGINGGGVSGANLRNTWILGPEPLRGIEHYAAFVTEIPRRAILAGTSERGACSACGSPWRRVVEREPIGRTRLIGMGVDSAAGTAGRAGTLAVVTRDWQPSCRCDAGEPAPCTVLDPFSGAGTTVLVADRLGRHGVGVELNPEYAAMSLRRLREDRGALLDATLAAPPSPVQAALFAEVPA